MAETKRVIMDFTSIGGSEVEVYPQSGSGGVPGPDTVGTEQIKNGAVEMEDLHDDVKDAMLTDNDRVTQEELDNFEV